VWSPWPRLSAAALAAITVLEAAFTRLQCLRGLHRCGTFAVTNALSAWLEVTVWREGRTYRQRHERGEPCGPVEDFGPTDRKGTRAVFAPDFTNLPRRAWDLEVMASRLRELAALGRGNSDTRFYVARIGVDGQVEAPIAMTPLRCSGGDAACEGSRCLQVYRDFAPFGSRRTGPWCADDHVTWSTPIAFDPASPHPSLLRSAAMSLGWTALPVVAAVAT
jgi:hypothetical protein